MAPLIPRGYRSATEYCFDGGQTDAIVRTAAYHRRAYFGIGYLDHLPLELLLDILHRLDIHSLFIFRQINLRSRQIVDSLSQYQSVVSHRRNLFCALLRTRLAIDISLLDFYDALYIKNCTLCGEFAGFISLLIWKRCCFKCLLESPETQVRTLALVRKQFHITKDELNQLRLFKSLPGIYSMNESTQNSRITIVSLSLACKGQPYITSCTLPYYDKQTGIVKRGLSCGGCQLAIEKDIIGTRNTGWGYEARDKVYARDGFLDHFRWCEQAQLLWRLSGEGRNPATRAACRCSDRRVFSKERMIIA
ncbi:unnamed protein product [Penicillium nalgiovense]|nr:unnamed protein product [Penicillium nalgiovense]